MTATTAGTTCFSSGASHQEGENTNASLQDDGTTACGCWIFSGAWTSKGNMMARRDNSDPSGLGSTLGWAFAWPANRRILYNRASCDPAGKPWDPKRKVIFPSQAELDATQAALKPVITEWASKSPRNQELLKAVEAEIAKVRAGR